MLASKISSLINPYFAPRVNGRVIDFTDEQDIELATNLEQHVRKLVQFERYIGNKKGLDAAGDYIKERWESMGLKVEEPTNFRGPQNHPKFPVVGRRCFTISTGHLWESGLSEKYPIISKITAPSTGILFFFRNLA